MSDANRRKREELSKKISAEIEALGAIDDDTLAAVQSLKAEEAQLQEKLFSREITEDEHFAQWDALRKRTPREVQLASLKITKTIVEALKKDPGATEA